MQDIARLTALRADLERRQDAAKELVGAIRSGSPYVEGLADLLGVFAPNGSLRLAEFVTCADETEVLVAHLAQTLKPDVPSAWTCNRFRRANGFWNQSFWLILQNHERVEGKAEHFDKMRAVHGAYMDLLARALELRIVDVAGRLYRLKEREETREARVLFDERMRLIEESVALVAQRRAQQEDQDAEWHSAAPKQMGIPA